jgi:hypothetical protein
MAFVMVVLWSSLMGRYVDTEMKGIEYEQSTRKTSGMERLAISGVQKNQRTSEVMR